MAVTRPVNLQKPFANTGGKNTIPNASQIGITAGLASYEDGFPPLTRTPLAAGGVPPFGQDMNGILFALSQHTLFMNSGGQYRFDNALSTALGGYDIGVVLQDNNGVNSYINILANNTTNFNTTPAAIGVSWLPFSGPIVASISSANNYYKFPNGLIMQWGTTSTIAAASSLVVSFPVTFPNSVRSIATSAPYSAAGSTIDQVVGVSYTGGTTNFTIYTRGTSPANGVGWIAFGN